MNFDFKMSGGLGDIIFALPTIRALGGGTLCICPSHFTGNALHSANTVASKEQMQNIVPLLMLGTNYVRHVEVSETEQEARYDLNRFREYAHLEGPPTIPEMILQTFGCDHNQVRERWLDIKPRRVDMNMVVIHRTLRYQTGNFPWRELADKYAPETHFVGSMEEWSCFCDEAGYVPLHHCPTLLDMAEFIAGSKLFAGNQSVGQAIAEGLKHRYVLEGLQENCNFGRAEIIRNPTPKDLPELSLL